MRRFAEKTTALACGCLRWTGHVERGVPRIWSEGRNQSARRVAWRAAFGDVPPGKSVSVSCPEPLCVAKQHLVLTTRREVGLEVLPHVHGEVVSTAKLTDDLVRMIRASPVSATKLAPTIGVSQVLVSRVRRREIWTHI